MSKHFEGSRRRQPDETPPATRDRGSLGSAIEMLASVVAKDRDNFRLASRLVKRGVANFKHEKRPLMDDSDIDELACRVIPRRFLPTLVAGEWPAGLTYARLVSTTGFVPVADGGTQKRIVRDMLRAGVLRSGAQRYWVAGPNRSPGQTIWFRTAQREVDRAATEAQNELAKTLDAANRTSSDGTVSRKPGPPRQLILFIHDDLRPPNAPSCRPPVLEFRDRNDQPVGKRFSARPSDSRFSFIGVNGFTTGTQYRVDLPHVPREVHSVRVLHDVGDRVEESLTPLPRGGVVSVNAPAVVAAHTEALTNVARVVKSLQGRVRQPFALSSSAADEENRLFHAYDGSLRSLESFALAALAKQAEEKDLPPLTTDMLLRQGGLFDRITSRLGGGRDR
jgi:hypothetical protein